uniref:AMP-dependent synthetase/ligase domain-containing protein n=1 Tax=Solanum lycopersicum TaxID=4081 RepID=A0A3Q7H2Y6_SOLLC
MNYENYDPFFPDQPVVDLYLPIWAKLSSFKSKPAFIWAEDGPLDQFSSITYEELNSSAQCISCELLLSLRKNDVVVVLCSPGLEFVEVIFGCQRAGVLAVPISPPHPSFSSGNWHHLLRVVSQTRPKVAIAQREYIKHVEKYVATSSNKKLSDALKKIRWISTEDFKGKKMKMQVENVNVGYNGCNVDDVYLIQYTSGTTAIPKPVLVTAGSAAHNVRVARRAYDLQPNTVVVSWLPQYHDCGLMFLLLTIVSGATCVLTSPSTFVNRPRIWLELISEFKATCTPVPSFALPLVLKRGHTEATVTGTVSNPISMLSLMNLIIVNEPIYNDSIEEFVEVFRPFGLNPLAISPSYGLAENGTFVSTSWRSSKFNKFSTYKKLLPSARLDEDQVDIEILVVNEDTNEIVEDGIEGEIWISSPSNAIGYLAHPSLTQQVFNATLKNKAGKCYVRTGDRGVIKGEERFLYVTGRCSDAIKLSNGQEIHPHYLETLAYNSCPNFLRGGCVAAFEMSESEYTSIVAVVVEVQSKCEIESDMFLKQICEGIRKTMLKEEGVGIGLVVLVKFGNVPKTTSGKIQRWLAKYKFEKSQMNIIMQMKFDNNGYIQSTMQKMIQIGKKEAKKGKKVLVVEEEEGLFFAPTNKTLKSSL